MPGNRSQQTGVCKLKTLLAVSIIHLSLCLPGKIFPASTAAFSCISQPKLLLNLSDFAPETIVDHADDFIDLRAGSNLTITCYGNIHDLDIASDSMNDDEMRMVQKYIEWILPEYHPVIKSFDWHVVDLTLQYYEPNLPEYVRIEEEISSDGLVVKSTLRVMDVEVSDVGYYTCTYRRYLHLIVDDNDHWTNSSLYLYVTGHRRVV